MILRFGFGILLGVFFYGGLWLTVRNLATTRHPFALTLGSLVLRIERDSRRVPRRPQRAAGKMLL